MAVWSAEYRRIGDDGGGWPGTFDDVQAIIHLLSDSYDELVVMGHSAGGHLALWSASLGHPAVRHVIGLAAISDLVTYAGGSSPCEQATVSLMGGTPQEEPQRYRQTSPLALDLSAPVTLVHGAEDRIVLPAQSEAFARRHPAAPVTGKSVSTRYVAVEGAGHFDVVNPASVVWPVLSGLVESLLREAP